MSTNISIKQLETFRTVMHSNSLSIAARTLCRTQPAISTMIGNLEKELGLTLFERHKGRLTPTPEAYFLLEEADTIIERLTRTTQLMEEVKNLTRGKMRIACMPAAAMFFMPHLIAKFVKDRPDVDVTMMMRSSSMVQDWVSSQQYDLGYCEGPKYRDAYDVELIPVKIVCAVHKDHPLANKKVITPQDLNNIPLASLYSQHAMTELLKRTFADYNATYYPRFELLNYISAFEFVENNLCCCLCEKLSAASYKLYKSGTGNVVFLPFYPTLTFDHAIITPSHKPMSQLVKAFKESITTYMEEFIQD